MKKIIRCALLLAVVGCVIYTAGLVSDRKQLEEELVRLHVVAQSDSQQDQQIKLEVRDAVLSTLEAGMAQLTNIDQAKEYIRSQIPAIEQAANETLRRLGVQQKAVVTFIKEKFPVRDYETFSLPSGVYESLRVTIGSGEGKNWWCVVFPKLCRNATSSAVADTAAGAGFSDTLTDTITQKEGYRIRFYLLDVLGKLENLFYKN